MTKRRVAVTGIGMVTPLGHDVPASWDGIVQGKSGISPIDGFDASAYSTRIGGAVRDFDLSPYMTAREARRFDAFIHYGVAAGMQAMADAGLETDNPYANRIGAAVGSGIGGIGAVEHSRRILDESGPRKLSPFTVPSAVINMLAGYLTIHYGLKGPSIAISTSCTSGAHNIGVAARMIQYGDADAMLVGGAERAMTPVGLGGFAAARAMSTRNNEPQRASRPWDRDRDGFVLSDGAGMLVLEDYELARQRGARIYAEVAGFGMSSDAYHMTAPSEDGEGAARAMTEALRDASIAPEEVDYINAHGTSTLVGDVAESRAIESVFGTHAGKLAVSSTKSMLGHLLGAAGAVEAIISVLSIRDQVAPPTINLDNVDERCRLDFVPHTAREKNIRCVLSNSFGFGGTNGSLLFVAPD